MKKRTPLQFRLFTYYGALILCTLAVLSIYYFISNANTIRQRAFSAMLDITDRITAQCDTELNFMDSIITNIMSSTLFRSALFDTEESLSLQLDAKEMNELVFSIAGPTASFYQIQLYSNQGLNYVFSTQTSPSVKHGPPENTLWADAVLSLNGDRYICRTVSGTENFPMISVSRAFPEIYGMKKDNLIEIQQSYSVFEEIISSAVSNSIGDHPQIYIYSRDGSLLYPLTPSGDLEKLASDCLKELETNKNASGIFSFSGAYNGQNRSLYASFSRSEYSGWTTVLVESEGEVMAPVYSFLKTAGIGCILIFALLVILSFYFARRITLPLNRLCSLVQQYSLDDPHPTQAVEEEHIQEIYTLEKTFQNMSERLRASLDQMIVSHTHEIQAQMLALQAQMDPHFLYNTLSLIYVLTDEGKNDKAMEVTSSLSDMLRYISSGSSLVSIRQELQFIDKYLIILRARYGNRLICEIQIPSSMDDILIPRLTLQPLIENWTKYGLNRRPPWKILLSGSCTSNFWKITIQDNGPGFSDSSLADLRTKLNSASLTDAALSQDIGGRGLLNIYTRLKLNDPENLIFKLENSETGGAGIIVGGQIKKGEKCHESL